MSEQCGCRTNFASRKSSRARTTSPRSYAARSPQRTVLAQRNSLAQRTALARRSPMTHRGALAQRSPRTGLAIARRSPYAGRQAYNSPRGQYARQSYNSPRAGRTSRAY